MMNYINHLNMVFQRIAKDSNLRPTHISLYLTLFQIWNMNRFSMVFIINRQEVMQMCKIGSLKTYHRCLKDLDKGKYLVYYPSRDMFKGSQVKLIGFGGKSDTTSGTTTATREDITSGTTTTTTGGTTTERAVPHNININKQQKTNIIPIAKEEVLNFFVEKGWKGVEGNKFFNYYQSTGWKTGKGVEIEDWRAAAENWMLRASETKRTVTYKSRRVENLKTTKDKDYGEPL